MNAKQWYQRPHLQNPPLPITAMATVAASEVSEGPVLSLISKRLRALRKKYNRILQMEEAVAQGKPINKEQEEVLRSKPALSGQIDELEKLRQPLSSAVQEELNLALNRQQASASPPAAAAEDEKPGEPEQKKDESYDAMVEDLLKLLYFGSLFDVKSQREYTSMYLTRTHERECCLTYDYVTDDATDPLGEQDLDLISMLGSLLISRSVDSSLSHRNALQRCLEHAKAWLAKSEKPIEPNANVTYAGLRERLHKVMTSDYFTTSPEMKASMEVAAAAASFQVPVQVQVEGSVGQDEDTPNFQEQETGHSQSSSVQEHQKDELEAENPAENVLVQQEQVNQETELDHSQRDVDIKEQHYASRRGGYQNPRGGRGGGRRGHTNGRGGGGRGSGRGGGPYQNGRNPHYEQPGNNFPRGFHNNRGRGGRGGGQAYAHHGSAVQGGHNPSDVGVGA